MVLDSDWRLMGQEQYLQGASLVFREYRLYSKNPDWDHDHCEFCSAKFSLDEKMADVTSGYSTIDEYRWICKTCFDDFKERFEWSVVSEDSLGENA